MLIVFVINCLLYSVISRIIFYKFNDMLCDLYAMILEIKMKGLMRWYAMQCYGML